MKKLCFLIGILAFAGVLISCFGRSSKDYRAESEMAKLTGEFTFIDGKPYVEAVIDCRSVLSLFDTGSTFNIVPSKMVNSPSQADLPTRSIRTVLGMKGFKTADAEISLEDRKLPSATILIANTQRPVIGAGLIFSTTSISISKEGFRFNPSSKLEEASHCDNGIVSDLSGSTLDAPIGRIYLTLMINDVPELVMLDTGNPNLLTGTQRDNDKKWQFPDGLQVVTDAHGNMGLRRYVNRTASLSIGSAKLRIKYKSFPGYVEPRVRFVLGAAFLDHYSLYLEPRRGKVCYFART